MDENVIGLFAVLLTLGSGFVICIAVAYSLVKKARSRYGSDERILELTARLEQLERRLTDVQEVVLSLDDRVAPREGIQGR